MFICLACNENTVNTFHNKEKALIHLLKKSNEQIEVFLQPFISHEMMEKILKYYTNEYIEILENTIYYKDNTLTFHRFYLETNDIHHNVLFDYMKRYHKIWCCIDENDKVLWINTCKVY